MSNIFDAPPEGALQTNFERPLSIEYRSGKAQQAFAKDITDEKLQGLILDGHVGFSYFDKEAKRRIPVTELTFVILEVYAGVSGFDGTDTNFWSNRVNDTRKEELVVYRTGQQGPFLRGYYSQIKPDLPEAAKYTKFVWAYCVQLDKVIEIKLTAAAERGLQRAAAKSTGDEKKWRGVFTLTLAQNDHLWGFHLIGYRRTAKDGEEYSGKGDMFFEPIFHCGILNPTKQAELHKKCCELQAQIRDVHERQQQKHESAQQAAPVQTNIRPTAAASQVSGDPFPDFDNSSPADDLPF